MPTSEVAESCVRQSIWTVNQPPTSMDGSVSRDLTITAGGPHGVLDPPEPDLLGQAGGRSDLLVCWGASPKEDQEDLPAFSRQEKGATSALSFPQPPSRSPLLEKAWGSTALPPWSREARIQVLRL